MELFVIQYDGAPALAYLDIGGGNQPHVPNTGFPNNSTSQPYVVPPFGPGFQLKDLHGLKLNIKMTPDGDDNWEYWAEATFHFDDGTTAYFRTPVVYPQSKNGQPRSSIFDLSNAQIASQTFAQPAP